MIAWPTVFRDRQRPPFERNYAFRSGHERAARIRRVLHPQRNARGNWETARSLSRERDDPLTRKSPLVGVEVRIHRAVESLTSGSATYNGYSPRACTRSARKWKESASFLGWRGRGYDTIVGKIVKNCNFIIVNQGLIWVNIKCFLMVLCQRVKQARLKGSTKNFDWRV